MMFILQWSALMALIDLAKGLLLTGLLLNIELVHLIITTTVHLLILYQN